MTRLGNCENRYRKGDSSRDGTTRVVEVFRDVRRTVGTMTGDDRQGLQ